VTAGAEPRPDVDWDGLRAEARAVAANAYAPYSRLRVGAAGLVDDGRIVRGCNVENASFGLSLCAECGLVSALLATGGGRRVALSVVRSDGVALTPCGRCRQVLSEVAGPDLAVDTDAGVLALGQLLPAPFAPVDVPAAPGGPGDDGGGEDRAGGAVGPRARRR
jgi:cytidine deaminase